MAGIILAGSIYMYMYRYRYRYRYRHTVGIGINVGIGIGKSIGICMSTNTYTYKYKSTVCCICSIYTSCLLNFDQWINTKLYKNMQIFLILDIEYRKNVSLISEIILD